MLRGLSKIATKTQKKNGRPKPLRTTVLSCILGLFVILVLDIAAVAMEVKEYQQNINLIAAMMGPENDIAHVVTLLKGNVRLEEAAVAGKEELKSYGYLSESRDVFEKQMYQKITVILIISVVLYGIYVLVILRQHQVQRQKAEAELEQLSDSLDQLSKRLYDTDKLKMFGIQNHTLQKIYGQLQSISDVMRLNYAQLNQEKEETKSLVTDISHQLKTPVAALKTCFDVLNQKDLSEEEHAEFSIRCTHQLEGLEALLQALISISRMEAGMIEIKKEPAVLFETIAAAVSRVYPAADKKQISIEMEAEEEFEKLSINHDRNWLCEAFINLLDNAVKYSPIGSTIHIRMIKRVSFLRIEIEDEGIGIPKSEYHKVFQRFYRGQSKEVRSQTGSGVGLYLTRKIISQHHGSIAVTSKWGIGSAKCSGSIFVIQIPILTKL